ncbi:MAG TPA: glycosyltransferase family 2 protein [Edaphocola sp.]|nr:glycosyltransferase family 2 protein [Edaphocola sp.]
MTAMPISVCILINRWRPVVLKTIESYTACCSEVLLGANGGFKFEDYPELLQNPKVKGVSLDWKGYGQTKNDLARFAENDWILSVDTDEVADERLQQSLSLLRPENDHIIFALGMCHYLGGRPVRHGAWSTGKRNFLRLYNRNYTQWDEAEVHESIKVPGNARIIRLPGQINHYTADSYEQFIIKSKKYARLSAAKYRKQKKKIFPGKGWTSAGFSFIKDYIFRLGFLDGHAGWQVAKGNALYTFWKYHFMREK